VNQVYSSFVREVLGNLNSFEKVVIPS